jgi:hypothetical protein
MLLIVRFNRYIHDDLEVAHLNFPGLKFDSTLQMVEQFKLEMRENPLLDEHGRILQYCRTNDNTVVIWVSFSSGSIDYDSFRNEIQNAYNNGLSGDFEIIDSVI